MRSPLCLSFVLLCLATAAFPAPSDQARSSYEAGLAAKKAGGHLGDAERQLRAAVDGAAWDYGDAWWALAWVEAQIPDKQAAVQDFLFVLGQCDDPDRVREATDAVGRLLGASMDWRRLDCPSVASTRWECQLDGLAAPLAIGGCRGASPLFHDCLWIPADPKVRLRFCHPGDAVPGAISSLLDRDADLRARTDFIRDDQPQPPRPPEPTSATKPIPAGDLTVFKLLDTAPIKGSPEHMGGGIMVKFKLYLEDGSAKGFKCMFKPRQGGEQTFRHEIAAYRIDRLCHMGHVPVVARRVLPASLFAGLSGAGRMLVSGGKIEGSLQQWIQNASDPYGMSAEGWSRGWLQRLSTFSADFPDHEAARQVSDMFLLDYLQGNMDRYSGGNILRDNRGSFWFIDNAEAFGSSTRPLHDFDRMLRFNRRVTDALRRATEADFTRELIPYLTDSELHGLLARRLHALAHVQSVVNTYGEAKAYL